MNIEELVTRMKKAYVGASLRQLAKECEVSHEVVRKLVMVRKTCNINVDTYNKIDAGLKKHGF